MKIRKAVIPSAGYGTRFLPATKAQPKEMLAVLDKPLIQYSVEEAAGSGIEHIAVIVSRGKDALLDHFDRNPELEQFLKEKQKFEQLLEVERITGLAEFHYIRQKEMLGLGHAILMAEEFVGGEPFAVLLPDDIFDCPVPCTKQLITVAEQYEASVIVLGQVDAEGTKKYGIIKPHPVAERVFRVDDMIEKPGPERAFSDLAIIGRYVFTPEIFQAIRDTEPDHRGEIQITDAIKLLRQKQPVYGYLFEGTRHDCGDKLGFLKGSISLALKRPDYEAELRAFLRDLDL
ncbi:MAG: UTP--glucose-1-phosphate uridylyltransferase GalU [Candidatus Aminicenantaceae bacterium]